MYLTIWVISTLCVTTIVFSAHIDEYSKKSSKNIWAVLVAGSKRWIRYRHQANVCHAYNLLIANGIPESRIITFMYDDIAYNPQNKEPGVIRNEPNGTNLYPSVRIDYTGEELNKTVFLNVLKGNYHLVRGIGSGRVVLSTKKDNILVFYTGLGDRHKLLEFPAFGEDADLYTPELISTFKYLHKRKSYKNILMFLESSHSGCNFDNSSLPSNINVMAVTGSGPDEDTFETWCSNVTTTPCYAGLFSYNWMKYAEDAPKGLSIFAHYNKVRDTVANTAKKGQPQHPQLYGDWNIGKLPISDFIGYHKDDRKPKQTQTKQHTYKYSADERDTIIY